MDPKPTVFFLLIGTLIGLSHLNYENLSKIKRRFEITALAAARIGCVER